MRIAVIADTHDNLNAIRRAIHTAAHKQCQMFLHLGDVVAPFAALKWAEFDGSVRAIYGNNDGEKVGLQGAFATIGGEIVPPPLRLEIGGKRILMMHEPLGLEEQAASGNFDYVFYGHLHHVDFRQVGGTFILNPGDGSGWVENPCFHIIDTETDEFQVIEM